MFNLEQQVVSLELAKRLKELNVKQESYFYWNTDKAFIGEDNMYVVQKKDCRSVKDGYSIDEYSAFTVAELGEMLPNKDGWKITSVKQFDSQWECANRNLHGDGFEQYGETEADARGKMLIYLLENNLIEVKALIQEEISKI